MFSWNNKTKLYPASLLDKSYESIIMIQQTDHQQIQIQIVMEEASSVTYQCVIVTLLFIWLGKAASGNSSYPWVAKNPVKKLWKTTRGNYYNVQMMSVLNYCDVISFSEHLLWTIISGTLVMEEGSAFFLGFLISKERTVSISKSLTPSLLVIGLKQQPPESNADFKKKS